MTDFACDVKGGHVDVIEDDESLRQTLHDLLTFAGYHVRSWRDATSFLEAASPPRPAVVVTDVRMPVLSGLDLHHELIARGNSVPVIYISGESTLRQGINAMKLGAMDFLVKPFGRDELLHAVSTGLDTDRSRMVHSHRQARFKNVLTQLSRREREVMQLLLLGFSNSEIMSTLGISLPTAKQYKSVVMRKLGVQTLSQLIQFGKEAGLTPTQWSPAAWTTRRRSPD